MPDILAHTLIYRGGPVSGEELPHYTPADEPAYRALYDAAFRPMRMALGLPPDCCPEGEALAGQEIYLLRQGEALAGAVTLDGGEIDGLVVDAACRGRGLGGRLLRFALHALQSRGAPAIRLHVADWNRAALRLYLRHGFVIEESRMVRAAPNLPPAAAQAAGRMAGAVAARLPGNPVSIYLTGSAVLGDYRPGWSDIDLLCLTRDPIAPEAARALVGLRERLQARGDPLARSVEGGVLPLAALTGGAPSAVVYWGTSGERLTDRYALDPFSRAVLLGRGVRMAGPEVRGGLSAPDRAELEAAVAAHWRIIRDHGGAPSRSVYGAGWMLDIARGLYTLKTGRVAPKTRAGQWALDRSLAPDPGALERVLAIRRDPASLAADPAAGDFVAGLGPAIGRFAGVLEGALRERRLI